MTFRASTSWFAWFMGRFSYITNHMRAAHHHHRIQQLLSCLRDSRLFWCKLIEPLFPITSFLALSRFFRQFRRFSSWHRKIVSPWWRLSDEHHSVEAREKKINKHDSGLDQLCKVILSSRLLRTLSHFFGHAGLKSRLRYVTRKEMRFYRLPNFFLFT